MRHRSINRNSAVASGSSFFNGWRSTPGTTPLTSQLILLISTTTTKVEIGSNAARLRLRSLTCSTGQPPSVRMDDEGATTSAAPPHSFSPQLPHVAVEHGRILDAQDQYVCHCRRYGRDWLRSMDRLDQRTCRPFASSGH